MSEQEAREAAITRICEDELLEALAVDMPPSAEKKATFRTGVELGYDALTAELEKERAKRERLEAFINSLDGFGIPGSWYGLQDRGGRFLVYQDDGSGRYYGDTPLEAVNAYLDAKENETDE